MESNLVGYKFDGGFYADLGLRTVLHNGTNIFPPLLPAEFDVLVQFLEQPRTVVRRSGFVLGRHTSSRALDDYVSRIEKKLPVKGLFQTVRGVGYRLEADVRPVYEQDFQQGAELYKASEMHFNLHTVESMRHGLTQALTALQASPSLADAHVTVAYCYINLSQAAFAAERPDAVMSKAREAADRALSLSPRNARALGILGLISLIYDYDYDYDWKKAEEFLQKALEINPDEVGSLLAYSHLLVSGGRPKQAFALMERAVKHDPTDMIVYASWGWIHLLGGDLGKAIELGQKAVSLYPQLPPSHLLLGLAYETAGQNDDALKHYRRSLGLETSPFGLACLGHLYGRMQVKKDSESALRKIEQLAKKGTVAYLPGYCEALVQVGLGEHDESMRSLEKAYTQRCDWLMHLRVEPRWAPIRKTTQFQALMRKVGIPTSNRDDNPLYSH